MILYKKIILFLLLFSFDAFALPKDDFANVFELATHSACKDIASQFQQSNNPIIHQSRLKALSSSPFPWRFEITNGYQEGFVYYALLGYANELSGDIPFAYRCYQNSLACIDEEKAFPYPLPRAEIYLAIGRTCLSAGRYMDAKDWLDTAFFEAGDNKNLQAAIDRVGIQRANEIGDYQEAIFLYQHLEELAKSAKVGRCESGKVERITDYGPRITGLTKPEIANYAQILFYSRKDREGFSKLLEGISKFGIDNDLGVKDPLVDKFLNNIMRADDDEVKWFYDLLGWAIVDARAKAGDEEYLAFLCNARTLFCKVYDFLNHEDDLKKVKKRIDEVRRQIADGYDVFGKESRSEVRSPRSVKKRKSKTTLFSKSGEMEKTPEIVLEDLLMLADWKIKHKDYKSAATNYFLASLIATGTFANIEYDGTSVENAAKMGLAIISIKQKLKGDFFEIANNLRFDNSMREAKLILQLYINTTNANIREKLNIKNASKILPLSNKSTLALLAHQSLLFAQKFKFDSALFSIKDYQHRMPQIPFKLTKKWIGIHIACGQTKEAFSTGILLLTYKRHINRSLLKICDRIWSWGNTEDINKYSIIRKSIEILPTLLETRPGISINRLSKALQWERKYGKKELLLREKIKVGNYEYVLNIMTNDLSKNIQAGHLFQMAKAYAFLGMTNQAYHAAMKSYKQRCKLAQNVGGDNIQYPIIESSLIESIFIALNNKNCNEYINWLNKRMKECINQSKFADANLADEKIKNLKIKLKARQRK